MEIYVGSLQESCKQSLPILRWEGHQGLQTLEIIRSVLGRYATKGKSERLKEGGVIFHSVPQRSAEWHALRLGIPTSSEFKRVVTAGGKKKEPKISDQAATYMYRLLAEWVLGEPVENAGDTTQWMDRGSDLEDTAISAYELMVDGETKPGGFCTTDDGMIGASPDRFVGERRILEIKCGLSHTQIGYLLTDELEADYRVQLQGQLYVCEREGVDIFAYHPKLPHALIKVERDERFIEFMALALKVFVNEMLERREELERRFGPFVRSKSEAEPDHSSDFVTDADVEAILAAQKGEL